MKAIQFSQFGPPAVLQYVEVAIPAITEDELLIKVHAAGVNPIDAKIRDGSSFAAKNLSLPSGLGFDVCGEVVHRGKQVHGFKVGDFVLGAVGRHNRPGAYAEFCVAKPAEIILKPDHLDSVAAAALPIAGLTAWQALHQQGQVKKGERVLIHAAAGGVGHLAVQVAQLAGAEVIATASSKHAAFLQQLNVNQWIDYTQAPFEEQVTDVDLVIDLVGGDVGLRSLQVLKKTGRIVTVPTITRDRILEEAKKMHLQAMGMLAETHLADLKLLSELVADDKLRLKIAATFPLKEAVQAHQMLEKKSTEGKIVLINLN